MTGLPALTVRQPWASLIAAGVKRVETRSWPTQHRGRLAIHAGLRLYTAADKHADRGLWFAVDDAVDGLERNNGVYDLRYGAIVATAQLVDCVPVHSYTHRQPANGTGNYLLNDVGGLGRQCLDLFDHEGNGVGRDLTAQLPLGDFTPGRYAWLLDDIKATTERCPWCMGERGDPEDEGWRHHGALEPGSRAACPVCDGAGLCDPIPTRGKQGLWRWTPNDVEVSR